MPIIMIIYLLVCSNQSLLELQLLMPGKILGVTQIPHSTQIELYFSENISHKNQ